MTLLSIGEFKGMDRLSVPARRPGGTGRHVENASLRGGVLAPLTMLSVGGGDGVSGALKTRSRFVDRWWHRDRYYWASWPQYGDGVVHFVSGLIPGDVHNRAYWTGSEWDGRPRMSSGAEAIDDAATPGDLVPFRRFLLGVPRLEKEPEFRANLEPEDPDGELVSTAWVHTVVSDFGEEGPPSFPSAQATINDGQAVALTLPTVESSFRKGRALRAANGAKRRIYRANTGTTGTAYQFVGEIKLFNTKFVDDLASHELGEVLPSETWYPPPSDLRGLVTLPGGILAGFSGDTVWISEPFLPHAWPAEYRVALDAPVVALGVVATGLIVLTRGRPYLISGADPGNLSPVKVDFPHGCVNRRSVVDMGGVLVYCGPDGLVRVNGVEGDLLTRDVLSSKEWNSRYDIENVIAFEWEGRYVAFLDKDNPPADDRTGFVFDPQRGLCDLSWKCAGGYSNPEDGSLQLLGLER